MARDPLPLPPPLPPPLPKPAGRAPARSREPEGRREQPPIGRYPSWEDKNPVRRTSAEEASSTAEQPVELKRGGRAKPKPAAKTRKR